MATPSRSSGRSVNLAQLVSMFLAFLMVAGVGGVLAAGFAMPAVAALGATTDAGRATFDDLDTEIGDLTLSERSTLLYSDGSVMATFYAEDRIVVRQDNIAPIMADAVVAVEDRRFYEHGAIDPEGIFRAVIQNLSGSDLQGASTLTQQYVKNVLLEQARIAGDAAAIEEATATTIGRKLREAKLAIALEQQYTKDEILNGYLNVAPFGPSQYGVEVASRFYFSKSAAKLDIGEAALLAGITQAPSRYYPVDNPENAFDRRNTVLALMLNQGYITQEDFDTFSAEPIEDMLNVRRSPATCAVAEVSAYFCNYVVRTILQDEAFGETQGDRYELLTRGGLKIRTTIDPELQAQAYASLTDAVPVDDESGISNAITTVEPGTGRILAMAQNTPYGQPGEVEGAPARTTEVNFNGDSGLGGAQGFQTGSTFKAFVLAAWLEAGNSLMDVVDGSQGQVFPREVWNYDGCTSFAPSTPYPPRNIEGIGTGPMTVLAATEQSVNTAFVDMASQLNMCEVNDLALRLGLHVGAPGGVDAEHGLPLVPGPAMTLGANNIAPVTMAAAFATFASGGVHCAPIAIDRAVDTDNNEIPIPDAGCERAISEEVAATVTYALQRVVETPGATGNAARLNGFEVAGKTGTANEDTAAWFVGYLPQAATAVWNGYSEGLIPMLRVTIDGRYWPQVYGGAFAAPIWNSFMSQAVQTMDLTPQAFPDPENELVVGERTWVPSVAGQSVEQATAALTGAGFQVSTGSAEDSESVPEGSVIRTSPGSGSLAQPGSTITLIPSSGPPDDGGDDGDGDGGGGNGNGNGNGDGGDGGGNGGGGPGGGPGGGGPGGGGDD